MIRHLATRATIGSLILATVAWQPAAGERASQPAGQQLITTMLQAIRAKNTYHAVVNATVHLHASTETVRLTSDASVRPLRVRTTANGWMGIQRGNTARWTHFLGTTIRAGSRAAFPLKSGWQCTTVSAAESVTSLYLQPLPASFQHPTNLGPSGVDKIQAWHVRALVPVSEPPGIFSYVNYWNGSTPRMRADVYIARTGFTLLREDASYKEAGYTLRITARYSRYGRAINIQLPAPCRAHAG